MNGLAHLLYTPAHTSRQTIKFSFYSIPFFCIQFSKTTNNQISDHLIFSFPFKKACQYWIKLLLLIKSRCEILFMLAEQKENNSFFSHRFQGKRKPCFFLVMIPSGNKGLRDSINNFFG